MYKSKLSINGSLAIENSFDAVRGDVVKTAILLKFTRYYLIYIKKEIKLLEMVILLYPACFVW